MRTLKRKLALSRETLRSLDPREAVLVVGGYSGTCQIQCGPTEVASCTSCVCTAAVGCGTTTGDTGP
jgi:hypothetical protein